MNPYRQNAKSIFTPRRQRLTRIRRVRRLLLKSVSAWSAFALGICLGSIVLYVAAHASLKIILAAEKIFVEVFTARLEQDAKCAVGAALPIKLPPPPAWDEKLDCKTPKDAVHIYVSGWCTVGALVYDRDDRMCRTRGRAEDVLPIALAHGTGLAEHYQAIIYGKKQMEKWKREHYEYLKKQWMPDDDAGRGR